MAQVSMSPLRRNPRKGQTPMRDANMIVADCFERLSEAESEVQDITMRTASNHKGMRERADSVDRMEELIVMLHGEIHQRKMDYVVLREDNTNMETESETLSAEMRQLAGAAGAAMFRESKKRDITPLLHKPMAQAAEVVDLTV